MASSDDLDQLESYAGRERFVSFLVGALAATDELVHLLAVPSGRGGVDPHDPIVDFALGFVALREQLQRCLVVAPEEARVGRATEASAPAGGKGGGWLR